MAFETADDLELAFPLSCFLRHVVAGRLVVSEPDDGDAVQCHVALPVAAPVEPVTVGLAAGRGDGTRAAEFGERGLVADAFGVVPGDDGDRGRGDGAGAVDVEQGTRVGVEDAPHAFLDGSACSLSALHALAAPLSAVSTLWATRPPDGRHEARRFMRVSVRSPLYFSLIGSGAAAGRPPVELAGVVIAVTGWDRSAFRWRSASTHPSELFGRLVPSPASTLRAAAIASMGSDLPSLRRTPRFGLSTSYTGKPAAWSRRASAAPNEFVPSTPIPAQRAGSPSMAIRCPYPSGSAPKVFVERTLPFMSSRARVWMPVCVSTPAMIVVGCSIVVSLSSPLTSRGVPAPRIQFVSATPVFGWLVFDITLPSSRYQTSLGVSQSRTFMGVSLISWTMACRSSSVRSSKLVLLGR